MQLQTIVYVNDMQRSIDWYSDVLGATPDVESEHWTSYTVGGATLALHLTDEAASPGSVELSLVATESLDTLAKRLTPHEEIQDQPFGRSFIVIDPDGTRIQVNEHS